MKVSLAGLIANCIAALPARADAARSDLHALEARLRVMKARQAEGEVAINEFLSWYLRENPALHAIRALPKKAGMEQFGLAELSRHITELASRKREGSAVIAEFFDLYV